MLLQAFGVLRHHLRRHTLVSTPGDSTPLLQPGDVLLVRVLGALGHHLRHVRVLNSCFFRVLVHQITT